MSLAGARFTRTSLEFTRVPEIRMIAEPESARPRTVTKLEPVTVADGAQSPPLTKQILSGESVLTSTWYVEKFS
jgi:hypothetical protein